MKKRYNRKFNAYSVELQYLLRAGAKFAKCDNKCQ